MKAYFYDTKIGVITIREDDGKITGVHFGENGQGCEMEETPVICEAIRQLEEYFSGKRKTFDLPLSPQGTDFQQKVWKALQEVPYGKTASYKDIAVRVGNAKACRAVGMANNRNPIAIIIPCHRIVGSSGKLVGYAGGLNIKEELLKLERLHS